MESILQSIQMYVTLLKDICTGVSAITAAMVAVIGLTSWKAQFKWKIKYETAQKYLRAAYKVRDVLDTVRNPFIHPSELSQAMREANIKGDYLNDETIRAQSHAAVYKIRWEEVREALIDLEAVSLEGELIWGDVAKQKIEPLKKCASTLFFYIESNIRNLYPNGRKFDLDYENKILQHIYRLPDEKGNDAFSEQITKAVMVIEVFLKPHLRIMN